MYLSHAFIVFSSIFSTSAFTAMPSTPRLLHSKSAIKAASDNTIIHHYSDLRVGKLVSRYKRFLADIVFEESDELPNDIRSSTDTLPASGLDAMNVTVVHCPNTGSMYNLIPPANSQPACACSLAPDGTKRKYRHTLEMIMENKTWVGVHSALANKMVENALNANLIEECLNFDSCQREVKVKSKTEKSLKGKQKTDKAAEDSRIDFQLTWNKKIDTLDPVIDSLNRNKDEELDTKIEIDLKDTIDTCENIKMLLEVKSVTLAMNLPGENKLTAQFPDSVSLRGQKHLSCLTDHVKAGGLAGILFLIQRDDCVAFSACHLDPDYGPLLHEAFVAGVKILPYHCRLNPHTATVELLGRLPFIDLHTDSTDKTENEVKEVKKQIMSVKKRKLKKDNMIENVSRISDMTTVDEITS